MNLSRYLNRETISYLIFGILTTAVDWMVYRLLRGMAGMDYMPATAISWLSAVIFAFITNKIIVFQSNDFKALILIREFIAFVSARIITGLLNLGGMWILVSGLKVGDYGAKFILSIMVIILNYLLSKWFIFKNQGGASRAE